MDICHVDSNVREQVYKMFGRTRQSAEEDVKTIKEWFKSQRHLPEIMEDAKIMNFLIINKFSIEQAKQKIDMYYTIKGLIPEFFDNANPKLPSLKQFMSNVYYSILPEPVDGLYRAFFLRIKIPNTFNACNLMIIGANIQEVRLYEDCMVGDVIFFDMTNFTLNDMRQFTPSLLAKTFAIYEKVYSLRIKGVYIFNAPSYVSTLMALLRPILKPKIFERFQIFQDARIMHQMFSKKALPKDYGGEGPSLEELNELIEAKFAQYQDRFNKLDTLRVNENLRPQKLNNDEVLGFYGNFKKLDVD